MYIVKLKSSLDGLGKAGDLVIASTQQEAHVGDWVIREEDGRRVIAEYQPRAPYLATVISADMDQETVQLLTEAALAIIRNPVAAVTAVPTALAVMRS